MSKISKIKNIEQFNDNDITDDEIELKPQQKPKIVKVMKETVDNNQLPPEIQIKPKKKINLSDEERERRRQTMLNVREKKMSNTVQRHKLKEELIKANEIELSNKMIKKANALRKKQEKEIFNRLISEQVEKSQKIISKKPKKVYYQPESEQESETESESEEDDRPIVIEKKSKKTKKGNFGNGGSSAPPPSQPSFIWC